MELKIKKVEEIAGELEAGLTCYVNKSTEEVLSVYENDDDFYIEEGADEDKLSEVLENPDNYLKVEGMSSQEEFFLMQNFVEELDNSNLKSDLTVALSNRKPFVMFIDIIDKSAELKEKWTNYKSSAFVYLVNQHLLEAEEE